MVLSQLQRDLCRQLAARRVASGESYVAGGAALNELLATDRLSDDVDLFHDTTEALQITWQADRTTLIDAGWDVQVLREFASFVEVEASRGGEHTRVQWVRDSAFRFFPLLEHADFGLTLHPFDLATNKVLALVGRLEPRDWVDVIECHRRLQPLGYLAWAACGKDPGFGPHALLAEAARSGRYTDAEIAPLAFSGPTPDARSLAEAWRAALGEARSLCDVLPPEHVGECVLGPDGDLLHAPIDRLPSALAAGQVRFHAGRIRGAFPQLANDT